MMASSILPAIGKETAAKWPTITAGTAAVTTTGISIAITTAGKVECSLGPTTKLPCPTPAQVERGWRFVVGRDSGQGVIDATARLSRKIHGRLSAGSRSGRCAPRCSSARHRPIYAPENRRTAFHPGRRVSQGTGACCRLSDLEDDPVSRGLLNWRYFIVGATRSIRIAAGRSRPKLRSRTSLWARSSRPG